MSFINSRARKEYCKTRHVSCLEIFVTTNGVKLTEEFVYTSLPKLKEELESVINDIDFLLRED